MTDTLRIDVAYAAPVDFVPHKGRNVRSVMARATVRVDIPVLSGSDGPVVLDVTSETRREVRRRCDGALTVSRASVGPGLADTLSDPRKTASLLYGMTGGIPPWAITPAVDLPVNPGRIVDDRRDEEERKLLETLSGVRIVDGEFHVPCDEPVICFRQDGRDMVPSFWGAPHGYVFRLDRIDEAREFHAAHQPSVAAASSMLADYRIHVLDVTLDHPEDRTNARHGASMTLNAGGPHVAWTPTPFVVGLGRLASLRDAVTAGTAGPEEVASVMEELLSYAGGRGLKGTDYARTAGIALDAVRRSATSLDPTLMTEIETALTDLPARP